MTRRLGKLLAALSLALAAVAASAAGADRILIRSTGSREAMRAAVLALGGTIEHEFQNVNALAATVPHGTLAALGAFPDFKVTKDLTVAAPTPRDPSGITSGVVDLAAAEALAAEDVQGAVALPADYSFNNGLIRADVLQRGGNLGQGVVVAVIDTGTANNAAVVPTLAGTVIGGQNFVAGDPVTSATSTHNGAHGTWVGTMIAGHGVLLRNPAGCTAQTIAAFSPSSVIDGALVGFPGQAAIPIVGVAPGARIYALKVFPSTGGGAPSSRILAAMDRALTMKKNFLAGMPSAPVSGSGTENDPYVYDSLDIQVVNLSLGGPTGIAGRDIEDLLLAQLVAANVAVATSAGNDGPSGLTTGSPATSLATLSSAAASTPTHERIVASLFYFTQFTGTPGCSTSFARAWRPSEHIQTATFSSRGPTADGRAGVSLTTAGDWNIAQAASGAVNFVSGTSFSAPTVAGAAALLRKAFPRASAAQIRNALVAGANPGVLGDGSTIFDQGRGYLDVARSADLLARGAINGRTAGNEFSDEVADNIAQAGLRPRALEAGEAFHVRTGNLRPGERKEYYLQVDREVASVRIDVQAVTPALPPAGQNQLFGDDAILAVHQAKTSSTGDSSDPASYPVYGFVNGPVSVSVGDLDAGILRLTVIGDWTNAGKVSAELTATALPKRGRPEIRTGGLVSDGEWLAIPVAIPAGTASAAFDLAWKGDWSAYPTNDIDFYLLDPAGNLVTDAAGNVPGATLNSPERQTVAAPAAGTWTVLVNGYTINGKLSGDDEDHDRSRKVDEYRLRVDLQ
jgi:subtilisin family serine protease